MSKQQSKARQSDAAPTIGHPPLVLEQWVPLDGVAREIGMMPGPLSELVPLVRRTGADGGEEVQMTPVLAAILEHRRRLREADTARVMERMARRQRRPAEPVGATTDAAANQD
jgi:hypothetical protein